MTKNRSFSAAFFTPVSAAGFGMMRVAFGLVTLLSMLMQWPEISRFYGTNGILPHELLDSIVRSDWRFSLLDTATPHTVMILYVALIVALVFATLGIATRLALIVSTVLLFSFHEYGVIALDGGDTLLRLIAFLLVISPSNRTFTLTNLWKRMQRVRKTGHDQPTTERTMSQWPVMLLTWQMVILYVSSALGKLKGTLWFTGSAVAVALHHGHFERLPLWAANLLSYASPAIGYFTVITQLLWILLIIIPVLVFFGVIQKPYVPIKRTLLLCGIVVHLGILLTMDVGIFSLVVFTAYLGLLTDDDFRAIRTATDDFFGHRTIILFDGSCGLCRRSMAVLKSFDFLHRLTFVNFHDAALRMTHAPKIPVSDLDAALHIKKADGSFAKGFYAFRSLCWQLPPLWILAPFLYILGISWMGEVVYSWVAGRREKCTSSHCTL